MKNHNLNPEEKVMCPECGILLGNMRALQIHRGKEHVLALNMVWSCKHCNTHFKEVSEFKKHLREVHSEKDFHCIICGKDCTDKRTLYYHEQLHLDDYGIECTFCNKKVDSRKTLWLLYFLCSFAISLITRVVFFSMVNSFVTHFFPVIDRRKVDTPPKNTQI